MQILLSKWLLKVCGILERILENIFCINKVSFQYFLNNKFASVDILLVIDFTVSH